MSKMTSKVFMSGRSQAVRIPKEFRFSCDEVFIERKGRRVILVPKPAVWRDYFSKGKRFDRDFPDRIEDIPPEEREALL